MSDFKEFLNEQLKDSKFKKEWDDIQPEMDKIRAMLEENSKNITQEGTSR